MKNSSESDNITTNVKSTHLQSSEQQSSDKCISENKQSFAYIVDDFDIPDQPNIKKVLVLSGGGIRGVAHIGVLQALKDINYLDKIEEFAGTSVGALILGIFLLGYSPKELWDFIINFDFKNIKSISIANIMYQYGLDSGKSIEYIIKRLIQAKGFNDEITLSQLFNITKKKLTITTVCLNTQQVCYISYENHPDLPLYLAIRMSISIPLYYTPVVYKNMYYVDGACIDNYPINIYKDRLDDVIGVYLVESKKTTEKIGNLEKYLFLVMQCLTEGVTYNATKGYEKYTIRVNMDPIISFNFNIANDKKKKMFDRGYQSVIDFFNLP